MIRIFFGKSDWIKGKNLHGFSLLIEDSCVEYII